MFKFFSELYYIYISYIYIYIYIYMQLYNYNYMKLKSIVWLNLSKKQKKSQLKYQQMVLYAIKNQKLIAYKRYIENTLIQWY